MNNNREQKNNMSERDMQNAMSSPDEKSWPRRQFARLIPDFAESRTPERDAQNAGSSHSEERLSLRQFMHQIPTYPMKLINTSPSPSSAQVPLLYPGAAEGGKQGVQGPYGANGAQPVQGPN